MNIYLSSLFFVSLAVAEPPVGDGYPTTQSSNDHYHNGNNDDHSSLYITDHQRSPSQEYGPPVSSHNTLSSDHTPNARSLSNRRGNSQKQSPMVRVSFNQRFSSAATRSFFGLNTPTIRSRSQGYAGSSARSAIPKGYKPPTTKSLSQEYETDSIESAKTLSTEYGVANARSSPSGEYNPPHKSFSQEYGTPSVESARTLSTEYGVPSIRSSPSKEYGPPASKSLSQEYGTSSVESARTLSTEYGLPSIRTSPTNEYGPPASKSLSQEYGTSSVESARILSNQYGLPSARFSPSEEYSSPATKSLSQEYGTPLVESAKYAKYGVPNTKSINPSPSEEYGVPVIATRHNHKPHSQNNLQNTHRLATKFQTDSMSHDPHGYNTPSTKSNDMEQGYDLPMPLSKSGFDSQSPSQKYGAPNSMSSTHDAYSSQSPSTSYGAPSTRVTDTYSQDDNTISQAYDRPNQRESFNTYDTSTARKVQSSHTNLKTDASYTSGSSRSAPSSAYLPSARSAMSYQQHRVPEAENKGYDYAKAKALDELLNQEPANYDFAYQIEDQETASDFGHAESRHGNQVEGSYFVVLPDGRKQTVEYEADEGGFKPRISVEPTRGYGSVADDTHHGY